MRQDRHRGVPTSEPLRFHRGWPGESLRPFVRNFWVAQCMGTSHAGKKQRIVPDGCIDIIFVRNGPTETYRGCVVGTMTRPIFEDVAAGTQYLGVRFAPSGFTRIFRCPAHEFTDRIVPLDSLSLSFVSVDQLAESPTIETSFLRLEECLSRRLVPDRSDPALGKALDTIAACRGEIAIAQLADTADCSPRHLLRLFRDSVGLGPKTYCRIVRFKNALRALRRRPRPDLLAVALEAGYYDQAHFIHDFNRFYGSTPSAAVSDSYNTGR